MKTSCLMVVLASQGMGAWGDVTPLSVLPLEISQPETFIDTVNVLVGMGRASNSQPREVSQAPFGRYHLPSGLSGPGPVNGLDLCPLPKPLNLAEEEKEQRDQEEFLRIMTDTPGDRFLEQMPAFVSHPPPVVILPNPARYPDLNTPPHLQLDTLDLSPGAQVDMRTVPADMMPGR